MSIAIKRNFTIPSTSAIGASEIFITSSTASTSPNTGGLQVSGGAGISGNVSVGQKLQLFNGNYFTAFISSATGSTTYTLPPMTPATGTSVLSSDPSGNLSWILMTATGSGSGLTLNTLTAPTQVFATGTAGTDFAISSAGSTHTFNIPDASASARGLINTGTQTIAGTKTFSSTISGSITGNAGSATTATSAGTAGTATNAGFAGSATTAINAGTAGTSVSAGTAGTSTSAGTAGTATNAGSAGTSVTAGSAGTAVNAGSASSSLNTGNRNIILDTTSIIYLTGSRSNISIGNTPTYVLSGVSALGNTLTATTFSGNATTATSAGTAGTANNAGSAGTSISAGTAGTATNAGTAGTATNAGSAGTSVSAGTAGTSTNAGTAGTATNAANINVVLDTTSTIYLTGSRSNASIGSTPAFVLSGVSALGNTLSATTFNGSLSGTASSAALVNTSASTTLKYLVGVNLNTAAGSTQVFTGSGITIGDNRLTTGTLIVNSGTNSTSTNTGALIVSGGLGISGQLSSNTIALGSTGVSVTPTFTYVGSAGTVITMSVQSDTTLAWEGSSGQLFSIDNNLSSGEIFSVSDISGLPIISASAGQTITLNEFGGFTQIGNGLASTSTSTGALRIVGGVGVSGNAYVGGVFNANAGTNSTSTTSGAIIINGGLGITGNANIGGTVRITNTTAATGVSSAAITVSGGAGIGQSLFVGGNLNLTGSINSGTNTYTKNIGSGDVALDNGTVDTPAILFYWANNRNMGIDTFYSGTGTTKFRIVRELNEAGGSELWSLDRNGIVTRSAWDVGEVINTRVYNNSDLSMSATTTINSTTYTNVATITYTPKSSTSHLWIEFDAHYDFSNGTTTDDFFSRITVAGSAIVEKNQIMVGQVGGGTRSGTIFPISGRYTNTSTSGIAITVQAKWGSADDNIRVYGSSTSGYMRIQEIGR